MHRDGIGHGAQISAPGSRQPESRQPESGQPESGQGDFRQPGSGLPTTGRPARLGIGGPVGSGKTALVAELCRRLSPSLELAVVTNDIFTTEDADFLRRAAVLESDRIVAVETGCCPHTAIRDDIAANLAAVDELESRFIGLELVLVESGGDNLTATFSYGLVDAQIFVIDVAGGDKVPRKGGPGIVRSDLLVVNKIDLAPLVGADLGVMADDARAKRGERPVAFISLATGEGVPAVVEWVSALACRNAESNLQATPR